MSTPSGSFTPPTPRLGRAHRIALVCAWLAWAACAVACVLIVLVDVRTVLTTGPIILLLGLVTGCLGAWHSFRLLVLLGVMDAAICVFFFLLVVTLDWQPRDADQPFTIMGCLFTLATLPVVVRATRAIPKQSPWACKQCGYLLYGLNEPRCPECGCAFDPVLLGRVEGDDLTPSGSRAGSAAASPSAPGQTP